MPNQLADETSPYLLQHKDNPVDWYPWASEALEKAKSEQMPIFLSIGYSACHWCHVMEHESFENEAIAKLLNEKFVCIKVDREERPDLDQIYMNATQMLTGRGGWPMSVFLTPELKPFYAGTYWPPHASRGMPGFDQVIVSVSNAWESKREAVLETSEKFTEELARLGSASQASIKPGSDLLVGAVNALQGSFDRTYGGFGDAPKFPAPMGLQLLLRRWYREKDEQLLKMVLVTLDRMASGGIYDHLGGGFARYSVDARWLVPHFEKMLYDNALLVSAYLEAYQITGKPGYAQVVRETLNYVLRDMSNPLGGFYSTEDADSEGVEGKFYVWTPEQIREVLGEEAAETFCQVYDVTDAGNFEHANILNLPKTIALQAELIGQSEEELAKELAESREKLFGAREKRIHPHKDDKVLLSWNALMIEAMARAGVVLNEPKYTAAAEKAAEFLFANMRREDGRLLHTWRHGKAKLDAYLDDYAYLANSLITLYETTFNSAYLQQAADQLEVVLDRFDDPNGGGFFYTADDHEELIVRNKDFMDSAVPSGNSMAAIAFLRFAKLTASEKHRQAAEGLLASAVEYMRQAPGGMGQMLVALDFEIGPTYELALAGDLQSEETRQAAGQIQSRFLPNKVLAFAEDDPPEILEQLLNGKSMLGDAPTLYLCEDFTCQQPAQGIEEIKHTLDELMPERNFD